MAATRTITFADAFRKGIAPVSDAPLNSQFLADSHNVRVGETGLRGLVKIHSIIDGHDSISNWPLPQVIRGSQITLLADETAVYLVTESADISTKWTAAQITTYDATDTTSTSAGSAFTITNRGTNNGWAFADFGDVWFLCNGITVLIKSPMFDTVVVGFDDNTSTAMNIQAIGRSQDRLFLGGISAATYFATQQWLDIFAAWIEKASTGSISYDGLAMTTSTVMFSHKEGGQFSWPFAEIITALGMGIAANFTAIKQEILRSVEQGRIGFIPMSWRGDIFAIKTLGQFTMIYGEDGITAVSLDPIDRREILSVGIVGRGAVDGNSDKHVFLDTNGILWRIDSNLSLTRLGYEDYIDLSTSSARLRTLIIYDAIEDEFYIGTDATPVNGFLLTPEGLTKIDIVPTSLVRKHGRLYGIVSRAVLSSDTEVIQNRDFSSAVGWTLGTNWSIAGNVAAHSASSASFLLQVIADQSIPLVAATVYRMTLNLATVSAASVGISNGEAALQVSIPGTYNEDLTATSNASVILYPDSTFVGSLGYVSARPVISNIVTHPFTIDNEIVSIKEIRVNYKKTTAAALSTLTVAVDYKFNKTDAGYTRTTAVAVDTRGIALIGVSGLEFRVILTFGDYFTIDVDSIDVVIREGGKLDIKPILE